MTGTSSAMPLWVATCIPKSEVDMDHREHPKRVATNQPAGKRHFTKPWRSPSSFIFRIPGSIRADSR